MKAATLLLALIAMLIASAAEAGGVRVRGYTRKDGTYVAPHYRSSPNSSKSDNYSTRGNYNPYTGALGTVDPYRVEVPALPSGYIPQTYVQTPEPSRVAKEGGRWLNYQSEACRIATDKALQLAEAANNLAKCASFGDLSDNCSQQTIDALYAAKVYGDATTQVIGACQ